jgi:nicotinate-nucleotide--dimethylbenzimidazole phosphoribosyltransferase
MNRQTILLPAPDLDALADLIAAIRPLDTGAQAAAHTRQAQLTKPAGSLGRLEELAIQIAGITGQSLPHQEHKVITLMAADHGIAAEGVSPYPQVVTGQMLLNFLAGGAAINVLARHTGARVVVVDMGCATTLPDQPELVRLPIAAGTLNMLYGPAMSRAQALQALLAGAAVVQAEMVQGLSILGCGDMGIANSTASAAIAVAFTGAPPEAITGRGAGLDTPGWHHKVAVVRQVLAANQPDPHDPLDLLAKVGGFEIGGLAGAMLAAAGQRRPVVIDGYISTAAAMVAVALAPALRPYLIAAHHSADGGHAAMLAWLKLTPLLDLGMRLGEGTGAALAMHLVESACRLLVEMATFGEAGVTEKVA